MTAARDLFEMCLEKMSRAEMRTLSIDILCKFFLWFSLPTFVVWRESSRWEDSTISTTWLNYSTFPIWQNKEKTVRLECEKNVQTSSRIWKWESLKCLFGVLGNLSAAPLWISSSIHIRHRKIHSSMFFLWAQQMFKQMKNNFLSFW